MNAHTPNLNTGHNDLQLKRLFKKAQNVSLTIAEKGAIRAALRARLRSLLTEMPAATVSAHTVPASTFLRRSTFFDFLIERKTMALALLVGLIALGGNGIASASQNALPGDFLYPWKTGIDEKIVSSLAGSPLARAQVETIQAATRLTEIEKLATEDKLTPALTAEASSNFNAHADNALSNIRALTLRGDTVDATEASNDLESTLNAHRDIIAELAASNRAAGQATFATGAAAQISNSLDETAHSVTNALITAVQVRTEAEYSLATSSDPGAVKFAAESVRDASLSALTNAENSLKLADAGAHAGGKQSLSPSSNGSDYSVASTQVKEAQTYQDRGSSKFNAGSYGDAIMLFGRANRHAEAIVVKVKAQHDIGFTSVMAVSPTFPVIPPADTATGTASTTVSGTGAGAEVGAGGVAADSASRNGRSSLPSQPGPHGTGSSISPVTDSSAAVINASRQPSSASQHQAASQSSDASSQASHVPPGQEKKALEHGN